MQNLIQGSLLGRMAGALVMAVLAAGCASTTSHSSSSASVPPPVPATRLTPMPESVTSFGAVTTEDWLYVFGGHKGERHDYSVDMVSGSLNRLRLSEGTTWQKLPSSVPGQGLALVAYQGDVYRIGGMAARNAANTKQDLYSLTTFQKFNAQKDRWEDLPALPMARSSHDSVVVGSRLYTLGGWSMKGGTNAPVWPDHALVLDLKKPEAGWREFPQPFQRRALAVAALGNRIYCIGGMDSDNKPTQRVEIYDTVAGTWSQGPDLPPGKFKGFGCSAIAQDGRVFVTAFQGDLLRLSADGNAWEVVGRLEHPRMAHRLVTAGSTQLIALGGDDGEDKRPDLELLSPLAKPVTAEVAPADRGVVAGTSK
ncbi:MAG: hypothetical protein J0M24_09375 [Verrucomicrobia bacterium]|nr:hypothetical protein [Verrucomicrobiota bacterium]